MEPPYPKFPDRYHWSKRFMMPKKYLYKVHVVLGYSPREIAELHKEMLGVATTAATVRRYLHKYGIYKNPTPKPKKKRRRRFIEPRSSVIVEATSKGVKYLNERLARRRSVKPFLDPLGRWYQLRVLNKFFRSVAKRLPVPKRERAILWFIAKNYPVSPGVLDLIFPNRLVIIDWPRVEEIRGQLGVRKSEFIRKIKVDRKQYFNVQKNGVPSPGLRTTARNVAGPYKKIVLSEISKEIMK